MVPITKKQNEFGLELLRKVSKEWEVSEEKAVKILLSDEYKYKAFFNWANAEDFLYNHLERIEYYRKKYGS